MKSARLPWLASAVTLHVLCAADFQPPILSLGATAPDFNLPGVDGRLSEIVVRACYSTLKPSSQTVNGSIPQESSERHKAWR